MSKAYTFRAQARADILVQYDWYVAEQAFDAAERFVDAVMLTAQQVLDNPGIGRREGTSNTKLNGLRSFAVSGFEVLRIHYLDKPGGVDVIRVLHTARDVKRILDEETD